jgi:Domain of unknown function (DUF4157)
MKQQALAKENTSAIPAAGITSGLLQRKCGCGTHTIGGGACSKCDDKQRTLQRRAVTHESDSATIPDVVHEVLRSPGQPLDAGVRSFMEPRFGHDFSRVRARTESASIGRTGLEVSQPNDRFEQEADRVAETVMQTPGHEASAASGGSPSSGFNHVRVHTDARAAEAARALNAHAFTFGNQIVFGEGQYAPRTRQGQQLMAHELAHVVQQGQAESHAVYPKMIQRLVDEARVSCATTDRSFPIFTVIGTTDPVPVIVAADARAIEMLDNTIAELSNIRAAVQAGEPPAFPVIADAVATALRTRLRLNPEDPNVWTGSGPGTIEIIITWYTNIRNTLNSGRVRYICIGPTCTAGDWARTIPGVMRIRLCQPFWQGGLDDRALTLIHETGHIYYGLEDTGGGAGNAHCLEQFMADLNNVPILPNFIGSCRAPR